MVYPWFNDVSSSNRYTAIDLKLITSISKHTRP